MDLKNELLEAVEDADWSIEDKILAHELAERYAELCIAKLQGFVAEEELNAIMAGLANVGAAASATGAQLFWDVVNRTLGTLLLALRPA